MTSLAVQRYIYTMHTLGEIVVRQCLSCFWWHGPAALLFFEPTDLYIQAPVSYTWDHKWLMRLVYICIYPNILHIPRRYKCSRPFVYIGKHCNNIYCKGLLPRKRPLPPASGLVKVPLLGVRAIERLNPCRGVVGALLMEVVSAGTWDGSTGTLSTDG